MTDRTVQGQPGGLPMMLKAALPVLPGVNLLPGVARHGTELPDLVLRREGVAVDPAHVAAYARVCGFEPSQVLPVTYPHMLAFGLHMGIMTDRSFPFPAIGTVHLGNAITSHRPLAPTERLDVSATARDLRPHPKGRVFDLVTEVSADGERVWESTSTYLRVGRGEEGARVEGEPFDVVRGTGLTWRLPGDLGRRYAAVSGDHNPIHLYPLTARAFGFKRQIAHGMWSKARCVAAFANRLGDASRVEVEFKKPVFLPGSVAFGSRTAEDGLDFSLTDPRSGKPHLVGRARRL
ncbi:Acyl dehydratase [Nocardioides scoriae]|uniref:Acyl dehydratase n=1 Tax=Nocardioides scoriae TaxID=642780 RepID=A0A1H1Q146_9ACTN|nr:MaoC/PaaZ C-terminal domain-containing protein [Nocardioides scoriae]SDS17145.1 Acyl dehydratase [Nocardioides scoriae]